MSEKSRNTLNIYLLVCALIGAALFYGCGGGVRSDVVPEIISTVTGYVDAGPELANMAASLRGATGLAGIEVWLESDYDNRKPTNSDGKYVLEARPGKHRIVARYQSGADYYKNITSEIEVQKGALNNEAPSMTLAKAEYVLKGVLKDTSDNIISGANNIKATIWGEPVIFNSDGSFQTPPMPATKTSLGEKNLAQTILVTGGGFQNAEIPIVLSKNSPVIEYTLAKHSEVNRAPYAAISLKDDKTSYPKNMTGAIELESFFSDLDGNIATYSWTMEPAGCGTFTKIVYTESLTGKEGNSKAYWTAPKTDMMATLTFKVRDHGGLESYSRVMLTIGAGTPNKKPVIGGIVLPTTVQSNKIYELSAYATDADGDALTYKWSATKGTMLRTTASSTPYVDWQAPIITDPDGTLIATISVTVTDIKDGFSRDTVTQSRAVTVEYVANEVPTITTDPFIIAKPADSASDNANPVINGVYHLKVGSEVNLLVAAKDAENDPIIYGWYAQLDGGLKGQIKEGTEYATCLWEVPFVKETESPKAATITVNVFDASSVKKPTVGTISLVLYYDEDRIKKTELVLTEELEKKYSSTDEITIEAKLVDLSGKSMVIQSYVWTQMYSEPKSADITTVELLSGTLKNENVASYTLSELEPGSYTIRLKVEDPYGQDRILDKQFNINVPPVVDGLNLIPNVDPNVANAGKPFGFEIVIKDDDDTKGFVYCWKINSNPVVMEPAEDVKLKTITKTSEEFGFNVGDNKIHVSVIDPFGEHSASMTKDIVLNSPPEISKITVEPKLSDLRRKAYFINEEITFTLETKDKEDGDNIIGRGGVGQVAWYYKEGTASSTDVPGSSYALKHKFTTSGTFTMVASITDSMGGVASKFADEDVVVIEKPVVVLEPTTVKQDVNKELNINPTIVTIGVPFKLLATYTAQAGHTVKEYKWYKKEINERDFSGLNVTGLTNEVTVQANTMRDPGEYYLKVEVVGSQDETVGSVDDGYKLLVNRKPEITEIIIEPKLDNSEAYLVGVNNNLKLSIKTTDHEDGVNNHHIGSATYYYNKVGETVIRPILDGNGKATDTATLEKGTYTISAVVSDSYGAKSATSTKQIKVVNLPKVTILADSTHYSGVKTATYTLDTNMSNIPIIVKVEDLEGKNEIESFQWQSTTAAGGWSNRQYQNIGDWEEKDEGGKKVIYRNFQLNRISVPATYTLRLTVKTNERIEAYGTWDVCVNQIPKNLELKAIKTESMAGGTENEHRPPYEKGDRIIFGTKATDEDSYDDLQFTWYINDDNKHELLNNNIATEKLSFYNYLFENGGDYLIKCDVKDMWGLESTVTRNVYINHLDPNPNVKIAPPIGMATTVYGAESVYLAKKDQELAFSLVKEDGTTVYDVPNSVATASWEISDSSTTVANTVNKAFNIAGTKSAKATVNVAGSTESQTTPTRSFHIWLDRDVEHFVPSDTDLTGVEDMIGREANVYFKYNQTVKQYNFAPDVNDSLAFVASYPMSAADLNIFGAAVKDHDRLLLAIATGTTGLYEYQSSDADHKPNGIATTTYNLLTSLALNNANTKGYAIVSGQNALVSFNLSGAATVDYRIKYTTQPKKVVSANTDFGKVFVPVGNELYIYNEYLAEIEKINTGAIADVALGTNHIFTLLSDGKVQIYNKYYEKLSEFTAVTGTPLTPKAIHFAKISSEGYLLILYADGGTNKLKTIKLGKAISSDW